ncbi:MAG: hypothetical protein IIC49_05975, partial [Planctomycetes bacterium]|nr:hypothetical protein [Planctomycetota bacterium]
PSRIGHLLDLSLRNLERILYFEAYVVVDPGEAPVKEKELLTEEKYRALQAEFPGQFEAGMGAETIKELVRNVDVEALSVDLRFRMKNETSQLKRLKYAKRLKVMDAFRKSGNKPEWMILEILPVIPPDLRPLVHLARHFERACAAQGAPEERGDDGGADCTADEPEPSASHGRDPRPIEVRHASDDDREDRGRARHRRGSHHVDHEQPPRCSLQNPLDLGHGRPLGLDGRTARTLFIRNAARAVLRHRVVYRLVASERPGFRAGPVRRGQFFVLFSI